MLAKRSTGTTPLDLLLSRPPRECTVDNLAQRNVNHVHDYKEYNVRPVDLSIQVAAKSLHRSQQSFNRGFNVHLDKMRGFNIW